MGRKEFWYQSEQKGESKATSGFWVEGWHILPAFKCQIWVVILKSGLETDHSHEGQAVLQTLSSLQGKGWARQNCWTGLMLDRTDGGQDWWWTELMIDRADDEQDWWWTGLIDRIMLVLEDSSGWKRGPDPKQVSLIKVSGDQEAGSEEAGTLEGSDHEWLPCGQSQYCNKI